MSEEQQQPYEHARGERGRWFLWGGLAAGVLLIVLLLTHGFGLLAGRTPPEPAPLLVHQGDRLVVPEGSPLRQRLLIEPAEAVPLGGSLILAATVESDPARTAPVLAPLGGRVQQVRVHPGERVAAGAELVVIDSPDLAQAYADYRKAADALALSGKNLERQEGQAKIGAVSTKDLDQARSDHAVAAAEYQRARARLRAVGAPADEGAARALVVRAPFAGSITAVSVATGNMVNDTTQPLLTLVSTGTVWVSALLAEQDVGRVAPGADAEIRLPSDPEHPRTGKVATVSDVIEPDSHRAKVRIVLDNEAQALKPNMFASVTVHCTPMARVVVPTSALLMNNDRTSVYVLTAPWTFERRVVEPDLQEGTQVALRAGVKAGERIVVQGGILLND